MNAADWVFRPEDFLGYLRRVRGIKRSRMRIPERLVLVFGGDDWRALRRSFRAKPLGWHRGMFVGRAGGRRVAIERPTIGSPAAAISLEEAAAMGARTVVAFGACGSLVPDLRIGSVVIPTRAYADEGTSVHYGGSRWSRPDAAMVDGLRTSCRRHRMAFREGGVWTTDAPYRESRSKARSLSAQGVIAVDMETSAIFTVARDRGLRAAVIFVVSDELAGKTWNVGYHDPRFRRAKREVRQVIADMVSGDLS